MSEKDRIIAQFITLHVIPNASRDEVVGWVTAAGGEKALKVKVTAAPEGGKANKAVLALLATHWKCARSELALVSGASGRHKRLKIRTPSLYQQVTGPLS